MRSSKPPASGKPPRGVTSSETNLSMALRSSAGPPGGRGVLLLFLAMLAACALAPTSAHVPSEPPCSRPSPPPEVILDATGCGKLVESYGIRPGMSWGTASSTVKAQYNAYSCFTKICSYWRAKYGAVPFLTYGMLNPDQRSLWDLPRNAANQTCNELSGPLTLWYECSAVQERYGILPLVSSGSATPNVMALFSSSGCDTSICTIWRQRYGVTPYVSYGRMPANYRASWDAVRTSTNKTCNDLSGLLDSSECGALVETYGIVPGSSWGSAGANVQGLYAASFCDRSVCAYWRTKYSVVPFLYWGTLPKSQQGAWEFVRQPSGKACNELSGPFTPDQCDAAMSRFGSTPGGGAGGWGSAPAAVQRLYTASDCDTVVCPYWREAYGIVPFGLDWGTADAATRDRWSRPRTAAKKTCDLLSGPLDPSGCGALVDAYNVVPGSSYGSLTSPMRQLYDSSDCDSLICQYWTAKHHMVPTVSWGSLPASLKPAWSWVRASGRNCDAMSGPVDATGCGQLVAAFNITPGYGMGSAGPASIKVYKESDCLNRVCEYWRTQYGVVPFVSFGTLPTYLRPSWDYSRNAIGQNCNELSGPLGASECGALQEAFGIVPGSTWGSAPKSVQRVWGSSNCDQQICTYWRSKYGVVPFVTYGSLPPSLQPGWNHLRAGSNLTCNTLSGPLDAAACGAVSDLYDVFPGVSWGRLDGAEARAAWTANGCNSHLCSHWAAKYEIKPWVSYGRLNEAGSVNAARRRSWDWPRVDNGNRTCNSLAGLLDSDSCGKLTEYFGVQPGFTWGSITGEAREMYVASTCDVNVCEYWRYKYGVVPGVTWGRLPESLKPSWNLARVEADNTTCNELVSGNTALVQRFAPVLRFYGSDQGFPMTAETYYTAGCTTKDCHMGDWLNRPRDTKAHVYYAVSTCGEQVRIKFHFFYAWQAPCNPNTPLPQATHQSDWEAVTVILDRDRRRVSAVQFEQHGGWYTRLAGKGGFETSGGRPVVYVGFQAHGAYHSAQAPVTGLEEERCSYYGDWRGSSLSWDTGSTVLVDLMAPSPETWIQAMRNAPNGEILWGAGKRISFRTDQWQPKCDARACTGHGYDITALLNIGVTEAGCARSQCPMGWKDAKVLGCYRCPKGYIDCGPLMCAKGSSRWNCANPFNKRKQPSTMGYAYMLPASDQGLLYD
ncbi:hypothetical protein HYH03_008680 [Edaphochlamys debaryana]|uniref:Uncharacterized protein n=1 Tax=Edaphochlamys debaryana TaxID=47281 RepID=A0A836BYI7_9CHLO|nr:hypothetical protein HYH03_008680 [Edaphochlamys debaryana]|eukprot:KAG2493017.1 hypothetical protein HYH03_008680 [Edaphochlamys debaryana]